MYEIDNSWKISRVCHEVFMKDILECVVTWNQMHQLKRQRRLEIVKTVLNLTYR